MYDYISKVKTYFSNYYSRMTKDTIINLVHNIDVKYISYPVGTQDMAKFDEFLFTIMYLPVELDNVDEVYTTETFYTQTTTSQAKIYLNFLEDLQTQIQSLKTLLDISKFTTSRG